MHIYTFVLWCLFHSSGAQSVWKWLFGAPALGSRYFFKYVRIRIYQFNDTDVYHMYFEIWSCSISSAPYARGWKRRGEKNVCALLCVSEWVWKGACNRQFSIQNVFSVALCATMWLSSLVHYLYYAHFFLPLLYSLSVSVPVCLRRFLCVSFFHSLSLILHFIFGIRINQFRYWKTVWK